MISGLQSHFFPRIGQSLRFRGNSQSSANVQQPQAVDENAAYYWDSADGFIPSSQTKEAKQEPPTDLTQEALLRHNLIEAITVALEIIEDPKVTETQKIQLLDKLKQSDNVVQTAFDSEIFKHPKNRKTLRIKLRQAISMKEGSEGVPVGSDKKEPLTRLHQQFPHTFKRLLGENYEQFKAYLAEKESEEIGVRPFFLY